MLGALIIFCFGTLLRLSLRLSGGASWSLILSSVNSSAWELWKPYAYCFIGWIIIELSVLRPMLLRFVCSKICALWMMCMLILSAGMLIRFFPEQYRELYCLAAAALSVTAVQVLGYYLYLSGRRTELFAVPLLLSLCAFVFLLLFLSFYPPHFGVFYDFIENRFGRNIEGAWILGF